jgi:hypothetical protein
MCFRRQSRKGKIMTIELANEHKSSAASELAAPSPLKLSKPGPSTMLHCPCFTTAMQHRISLEMFSNLAITKHIAQHDGNEDVFGKWELGNSEGGLWPASVFGRNTCRRF